MNVWFRVLALWLCLPMLAWAQAPGTSTAPGTQIEPPGPLPPPGAGEHRSLTAQEIGGSEYFSHQTSKTLDSDGSGTVTLFELGDALRKKLEQRSSAHTADVSPITGPTPALKNRKNSVVGHSKANTGRGPYEAFRARQMNETGSLPSVAPNIIEMQF